MWTVDDWDKSGEPSFVTKVGHVKTTKHPIDS